MRARDVKVSKVSKVLKGFKVLNDLISTFNFQFSIFNFTSLDVRRLTFDV